MTCLNDDHSRYLHSILEQKTKPNHLKVLDVVDESVDSIRKQYLKLSRIYHPDKCNDVHSNDLFLLISNSFNILTNGEGAADRELNLQESLSMFVKVIIGNKCEETECNIIVKAFLRPKELSLSDKLSLTCTIYKLFINKNE